jgi:hypothetical protein
MGKHPNCRSFLVSTIAWLWRTSQKAAGKYSFPCCLLYLFSGTSGHYLAYHCCYASGTALENLSADFTAV